MQPIRHVKPQLLTEHLVARASVLITMGCGEQCPVAPHWVRRLDWELADPKDAPLDQVRVIRNDIRGRVVALINENRWQHS